MCTCSTSIEQRMTLNSVNWFSWVLKICSKFQFFLWSTLVVMVWEKEALKLKKKSIDMSGSAFKDACQNSLAIFE